MTTGPSNLTIETATVGTHGRTSEITMLANGKYMATIWNADRSECLDSSNAYKTSNGARNYIKRTTAGYL